MTAAHWPYILDVAPDFTILAERVVARLAARLETAPSRKVAIALLGSSTPRALLACLSAEPCRSRLPWERVHWRWGDERFVALEHPDSNDHRASETLLVLRLAPPSNIHPALTDRSSPDEAASRYTGELAAFYGADRLDPQRPLVEAVLPGLDRTRHTASLFSGSPALNERQRWVTPAIAYEARPLVRVALTPPVLGSMKATAFLVSCIDKRSILVKILGELTKVLAPRLWIQGSITWFAIESAWSEGSEDISPTGTAAGVTGSQLC